MINRALYVLFGAFLASAVIPASLAAQSYSIIDDELGIYCADLPDGTNMVVSVASNNGLHTVNTLDPEAQKAEIIKQRKQVQRRISTLAQLKRDYDPSADGAKLKQVFKFVINEVINDLDDDNTLESTKPNKIYKKIGEMIRQLRERVAELNEAIATIDRCVKNEDLIPPPEKPASGVITFSFRHPDYGTTEVMRGIGVTGVLHKKRFDGTLCVSGVKYNGKISVFPKESAVRIVRNPCLAFFQTSFRNYPFCHYGSDPNTAVAWIGNSQASVGFSQKGVDEKELKTLQQYLETYKFSVRVPTKKKPCRIN